VRTGKRNPATQSHWCSDLQRLATQKGSPPSIWGIIVVISDPREYKRTRARSNGRSMVLPAGGVALVCAAGGRCMAGAQHGLLRGWLLPYRCASSPQTASCAAATIVSDGLRARHECLGRDYGLLHVLLPGPGACSVDSGRIFAAGSGACSVC